MKEQPTLFEPKGTCAHVFAYRVGDEVKADRLREQTAKRTTVGTLEKKSLRQNS